MEIASFLREQKSLLSHKATAPSLDTLRAPNICRFIFCHMCKATTFQDIATIMLHYEMMSGNNLYLFQKNLIFSYLYYLGLSDMVFVIPPLSYTHVRSTCSVVGADQQNFNFSFVHIVALCVQSGSQCLSKAIYLFKERNLIYLEFPASF